LPTHTIQIQIKVGANNEEVQQNESDFIRTKHGKVKVDF
jgi:hypothetical protein